MIDNFDELGLEEALEHEFLSKAVRREVAIFDPSRQFGNTLSRSIAARGHGAFRAASGNTGRVDVLVLCPPAPESAAGCGDDLESTIQRLVSTTDAGRLVLLSSLEALGPLEDGSPDAFEDQNPRPLGRPGEIWLERERVISEIASERGLDLVTLRPGTIVDDENPGPLAALLRLYEDGDPEGALANLWSSRPFQVVHRADIAQAILRTIEGGSGIYHISDHTIPTVGQWIEKLAPCLPIPIGSESLGSRWNPASLWSRHQWRYPDHRIREELGYRPWRNPFELPKPVIDAHLRARWKAKFKGRAGPIEHLSIWWFVADDKEARERDERNGECTLVSVNGDQRFRIRAAGGQIWASADAGPEGRYECMTTQGLSSRRLSELLHWNARWNPPGQHLSGTSLRSLCVSTLRLGFRDERLRSILAFAARHNLIEQPRLEADARA